MNVTIFHGKEFRNDIRYVKVSLHCGLYLSYPHDPSHGVGSRWYFPHGDRGVIHVLAIIRLTRKGYGEGRGINLRGLPTGRIASYGVG